MAAERSPTASARKRAGTRATSKVRQPAVADNRTRQPRGHSRRQQILDAAVELFGSKGYRGTGIAALAERVGMTAPGMMYYFGSKKRLLEEVVAERNRADAGEPGAFLTLSSMRELGRHNIETADLTRLFVVLGAESLSPIEPLHEFFVDRYESGRALIRAVLEAEQASGSVRRDVDVQQIATEALAALMGLEIQWLTDPARVDLVRTTQAYFDRLIAELGPRPPA